VANLGAVAIVAGLIQTALTPATAGASGVSGGATVAGGVSMIFYGSALQTVGKFGKVLAASKSGQTYEQMDYAKNAISLNLGLLNKVTTSVASVAAGAAVNTPGDNPCE
jgi:hypothetical protein